MDKTGLELQQLKGKLGQVAHIDVWLCSNSGSKSLFFQKSRTWSVSAILIRLVDPKIGKAMHLKRRNQKKIQYNKIQKKLYFERGVRDDPYGPFIKIFKKANMKIQHYKGCAWNQDYDLMIWIQQVCKIQL